MANPPTAGGSGLGALTMAAAKMTLKVALNTAVSNSRVVNFAASRMYSDETGGDWAKLDANGRAIWMQRVRSVILAVAETVPL